MVRNNEKNKIVFKEKLKTFCLAALNARLETILEAMKNAQESANNETKSSAGDKHETGRAMSQLENEMNAKQLLEITAELNTVQQIDVSKVNFKAVAGAFVICKHDAFFIITGMGVQIVEEKKVVFLSPKAPLAVKLKEVMAGQNFEFNKIKFEVLEVF